MKSVENVTFDIVKGLDHWYVDQETLAADAIFNWAIALLDKDKSPQDAVDSGAEKLEDVL